MFCFVFFTDPKVPWTVVQKKSIHWSSFLNVFTPPFAKTTARSRPHTFHRDPDTGLPADQPPIPLTLQPEGYFGPQNLTACSLKITAHQESPATPLRKDKRPIRKTGQNI